MEEYGFRIQLSILKPIGDVFDAVVDHKKLSSYFIQTSSGPLREGEQVIWRFAEAPMDVPVTVRKVVRNELIRLEWEAHGGEYNTQIDITFKPLDSSSTLVSIAESGWRPDEKGLKNSYDNCGGWMHMACCLKAFLEYGINLRKGSFLGMDFT